MKAIAGIFSLSFALLAAGAMAEDSQAVKDLKASGLQKNDCHVAGSFFVDNRPTEMSFTINVAASEKDDAFKMCINELGATTTVPGENGGKSWLLASRVRLPQTNVITFGGISSLSVELQK